MKPVPPLEAFPLIHSTNVVNDQIFTDFLRILKTLSAKFETLVNAVKAIDPALPTKRQKQGFLSRLSGQVDFPNAEPRLTRAWDATFASTLSLPHMGQLLQEDFIQHLGTIQECHLGKIADLEGRWKQQLDTLESIRKKSQTAYSEYRKQCEAIEALHTKVATNPAVVPELAALKASLKTVLEPAVLAASEYQEALQDSAVSIEAFLAEFEEIDQAKYSEIEQIFRDLAHLIDGSVTAYQAFVDEFDNQIQSVVSVADVDESIELEPTAETPVKLGLEVQGFDVDVTSLPFVDVRELFDQDLKKFRGKVTGHVQGFEVDEPVTVIGKEGARVVVEKASGEVGSVPEGSVEKVSERKLAKLNEAFEKLREGETVLVIEWPASAACIVLNVFRETFAVPASKLTAL
jgi:hypothetical protein